MAREPLWITAWRMNRMPPLIIGVLLVLNLAAWAVAILVVAPRQEELGQQLLDLQATYRAARQGDETPNALEAVYRSGRRDLQTFRDSIPPEEMLTGLIDELFTLSRQAGLQIERINYDPEELEKEKLRRYTLIFNVSGDYGQLKKFVYLIEHSPRLVAIEQLVLNAPRDVKPDRIGLRLSLTTYFRLDRA